jgi:hypothetical protein
MYRTPWSMPLKLTARWRKRSPGFIAREQGAAEQVLERVDSRADGRLAHTTSFSGTDKIASFNDRQKVSGQLGVHCFSYPGRRY